MFIINFLFITGVFNEKRCKATAKDLIDKHFKPEIDYKILLRSKPEEDISDNVNKKWGGYNSDRRHFVG
uniref:Uncharacterized protein n=1 Tax=viral metagenome TaxID=1070528 RepID=A0A6C0B849_9ZZZZ